MIMRGTAIGEKVQSTAQTKAWDENADRIGLGKGEGAKERGVFVWDPAQGKLVRPWEKGITEEERALDAPILAGRFYENVPSPIDGHVFTSRADYNRYMKERGLASASDYDKPGGYWDQAAKRMEAPFSTPEQKRARQDAIGRRLYEVEKMPQAKYDRAVEEANRKRRERREQADKA